MSPRVIGIGRLERGDDAAGPLVVRALNARLAGRAELFEVTGEMSELLQAWEGADLAILVDAVRSGAPPGTLLRWDAGLKPLPIRAADSTHGFGLAETLELARTMGTLPRRVIVHGIEGRDWTEGAPPSPPVAAGIHELAERVAAEVEAIPGR